MPRLALLQSGTFATKAESFDHHEKLIRQAAAGGANIVVTQDWHTPGHVSIRIRSRGADALITGDFTHHPCQMAHPDWSPTFDSDPHAAAQTRALRSIRELRADRPELRSRL